MLKRPRSFILLPLLAGCVEIARDSALNDRLRERPATGCSGAFVMDLARPTRVPLEVRFGLPAVRASSSDRTLSLLVDSGAQFCLLRPGVVVDQRLPVSGRTQLSLLGETEETLTTCVHDLRLGDLRCRHLPFVVSHGYLERRLLGITIERLDGVLGMSFLQHFAFTLDMSGGSVWFTPADTYIPPAGEGVSTIPITMLADGRPCLAVTLHDGRKHPFLLDTGARRSVVRRELARRIGLPDRGEVHLVSLGVEVAASITELPRLVLDGVPGGIVLEKQPAYILPENQGPMLANVEGLLGIEIFEDFVVTIDPLRRTVVLQARR